MKKVVLCVAAAMCAFVSFARDINVKVTNAVGDGLRYYVEYEMNGVKYRSDRAPVRVNQIAWSHMSDADKRTTVEHVYGVWNSRASQFGVDFAAQMAKWYDTGLGWTDGVEVLKSRLVNNLYPGLADRLSEDNRKKYFEENFSPTHYDDWYHSPYEEDLMMELRYWESLACSAYDSLENAAYIRVSAAIKSTSGDLIQLITDRCLVPNITPAGSGGLAASALGMALDYANNITGAQDKLMQEVVGERATAAAAMEVIKIADEVIETNYEFIQQCLENAHKVQNKITAMCADFNLAKESREDAINADIEAMHKHYESLGATAKPTESIVSKLASDQKNVNDKSKALESARKRYYDNSTEENRKAYDTAMERYNAAVAAAEEYKLTKIKNVLSRWNSWSKTYFDGETGKVTKLAKKADNLLATKPVYPEETIYDIDAKMGNFALTTAEGVKSAAIVDKYINDERDYMFNFYLLTQDAFALGDEMFESGVPILCDMLALKGSSAHDDNSGKFYYITEYDCRDFSSAMWTIEGSSYTHIYAYDGFTYSTDGRREASLLYVQAILDRLNGYEAAYGKHQAIYGTIKDLFGKTVLNCEVALQVYGQSVAEAKEAEAAIPSYIKEEELYGQHLCANANTTLGKQLLTGGDSAKALALSYKEEFDALDQNMNDKLVAVDFSELDIQLYRQMAYALVPALRGAGLYAYYEDAEASLEKAKELYMASATKEAYEPGEDALKVKLLQRDFSNRAEPHDVLVHIYTSLCANDGRYESSLGGKTSQEYDLMKLVINMHTGQGAYAVADLKGYFIDPVDQQWHDDYEGTGEDSGWLFHVDSRFSLSRESITSHISGYNDYLASHNGEKEVYTDLIAPYIAKIDAARAALPRATVTFLPNCTEDYNTYWGTEWVVSTSVGAMLEELPEPPYRNGHYEFDGWWTAPEGGEKVSEETVVEGDTVYYYAHWIAKKFTVVLHKNDGTGTEEVVEMEYGKPANLPGAVASLKWAPRRGFMFMGWAEEEKSKFSIFKDKESVEYWMTPDGRLDLYAIWTLKTSESYAIQYIRNDGSGMVRTVGFTGGKASKLNSVVALGFARRGYDFLGWAKTTANARDKKVWNGDCATVIQPVANGKLLQLYAIWKLKDDYYTIRFNKNDGSGAWRELGYEYGKNTTLPTIENGLGWGRPGYTFVGWRTKTEIDKGGTKIWLKDKGVTKTPIAAGKTLSIYAIWEKDSTGVEAPSVCTGEECFAGSAAETPVPVVQTVQAVAYFAEGDFQPVEARVESDGFTVVELGGAAYCGYVSDGVGELLGPDGSILLVVIAVE